MPRSKGQKHYHWDIDDPHQVLADARHMVDVFKALRRTTQAEAVADLIIAGYQHLVSAPPTSMKAENTRKSAPKKHRPLDREAA
jgi:hypothetical protein